MLINEFVSQEPIKVEQNVPQVSLTNMKSPFDEPGDAPQEAATAVMEASDPDLAASTAAFAPVGSQD